jgi:hypothetical protein
MVGNKNDLKQYRSLKCTPASPRRTRIVICQQTRHDVHVNQRNVGPQHRQGLRTHDSRYLFLTQRSLSGRNLTRTKQSRPRGRKCYRSPRLPTTRRRNASAAADDICIGHTESSCHISIYAQYMSIPKS